MYKTSITLKQHTPIIHFQHDQEGATLRATELKPKLDRYLIKKLGNEWSKNKLFWKVGGSKGMHDALDYKIRIVQRGNLELMEEHRGSPITPMFFANMRLRADDPSFKKPLLYSFGENDYTVELKFFSFKKKIIELIESNCSEFFAFTNFGMRQSKGYGSYYVDSSDPKFVDINTFDTYRLKFSITANSWLTVFEKLDMFNRLLRSGINEVRGARYEISNEEVYNVGTNSIFYCKPVIFLYALDKLKKQWDKKSIKDHFLSDNYYRRKVSRNEGDRLRGRLNHNGPIYEVNEPGLPKQKERHNDLEGPLEYEQAGDSPKLLLRDVFGLSTDQSWRSYGASLKKEHHSIARMKSPLTYKVIKQEGQNTFNIYLFTSKIPSPIEGEMFKIAMKSDPDYRGRPVNNFPKSMKLKFPDDFKWDDFFEYLRNDFNLDQAVSRGVGTPVYETLNSIINQIQN